MLKNIIIIENGKEIQYDDFEAVVKNLIDENFYNMTDEQKKEKIRMMAIANCIGTKIEIIEKTTDLPNLEEKFIIKDEMSYILSLLTTNKILLLENKDSNIFTKGLDKTKINNNYIIVNTYAKEILKQYIKIM